MSLAFDGTPVTRALLAVVVTASALVIGTKTTKHRFAPGLDQFVHLFVFRHPVELIFGAGLLYYFRLFERQLGSSKYGSFAVATLAFSFLGQLAVSSLFSWPLTSGPYSLIYANFASFVLDVPPVQSFSVLGRRVTDKAFVYLAGTHLLCITGGRSSPAALCGVLFSLAYRWNLLGLREWVVPTVIGSWFDRIVGPILGGDSRSRITTIPPAGDRGARTTARPARTPAPAESPAAGGGSQAVPPPPQPTDPDAVNQLLQMGFDPAKVTQALQQTNNDVEAALSLLL